MLTVKFDDRQFQNGLNALLSRVQDTRGLLDAVGREAAKQMSENFVNAGVGGVLWESNKPATLAKKKGSRPLTDTGDLMNITHKVADDGKSVSVGTNQEYGKYHLPPEKTKRAKSPKSKLPTRDWLDFSEEAKADILDTAKDFLKNL